VDTPWDWHHRYRLKGLAVTPAHAGQPRVDWTVRCIERTTGTTRTVEGHVEIRWSHGRFGQPPEAKIYLDSPVEQVPGYNALEPPAEAGQGRFTFA